MSLETDVASLVTQTTKLIDYFNGRKAGIDGAVAAAIAAIPAGLKVFYVNQLTGIDTNDGATATPLKTIDKALANTPVGGICRVYLQADYQMLVNITVEGRFLTVFSDASGVKRKILPAYYPSSDNSVMYMAGFALTNGGSVMLQDMTIPLPSPAGLSLQPTGFTWSLFKTTSNGGTPFVPIKLTSCEITAPADFLGWIIGSPNSAVIFEVLSVSFPSGFNGRYVHGVVANTAPATLSNILTNLPAL